MILKFNDRIRTRRVDFFDRFNMSLRYDSFASTFAISGYFNPDNSEQKDLYTPSHYHIVTIEHNSELLLTGYILSQKFTSSAASLPVSISGYSLPGPLVDCNIPPVLYPLQFDKLCLREIAEKLIKPFGLKMVIDPSVSSLMNEVYEKVASETTQTIYAYLANLAGQKNIVISHNEKGQLLFTRAKNKQNPILHYGSGGLPFTSLDLVFDGQGMHSHITVMKQVDSNGGNAGESEVRNPYVPHVFRPKVITQNAGDDNDTLKVAQNTLAEELRNLKVTLVTDRWEINGKIIKPNNLITVTSPANFLYEKTKLFIESIDFVGDNKSMTATLNCVLPEVYTGETPKYIFAGINER